jgi:hypothetical protein
MRSAHDYRRYAAECLQLATSSNDPHVRSTLQHMAQVWLRLAEQRSGDYRRNADDCLQLATTSDDPQVRVSMVRMSDHWLRLAEQKREPDDTSGSCSKTAE